MSRAPVGAVLFGLLAVLLGGCGDTGVEVGECHAGQRLAIVAQSVPGAGYVPCLEVLPTGWRASSFEVDDDGTRFELRSDRAEQPAEISLSESCQRGSATRIAPRAAGVRSYLRLDSISPRFTGRFYDVFSGGCITAAFDFVTGPHVALVDELRRAVGLYPRRQLRRELEVELGITLDP